MTKILNCECGYAIRTDDEPELVERAREHLDRLHPDVSAAVSDQQLLAMSEEE